MIQQYLYALILCSFLMSCQNSQSIGELANSNPPAVGFNAAESDDRAIAIADQVMMAMGGRTAWDTTSIFQWTFFGRRTHTWDKAKHMVHITVPNQDMVYQLDMSDMSGTVIKNGISYTEADSLSHYLEEARRMWINDSYWLFMPFKLKDSGVKLRHLGVDTTLLGDRSDLLEMTFSEVGVSPDNKYIVYVDQSDQLVKQWDYYPNATDTIPRFQSLWTNYKPYGDILLSGAAINGTNAISAIRTGKDLIATF